MAVHTQVVLGGISGPAEDDLRLPRAPGALRRWLARHPWVMDVALVVLSLVLTVPAYVLSSQEWPTGGWGTFWHIVGPIIAVVTAVALLWRRHSPLTVFAVTFAPVVLIDPILSTSFTGPASLFALYAVAVYRSTRAAMWALGAAIASTGLVALGWMLTGTDPSIALSLIIGTSMMLLVGALIGVNVGGRKRYVEALIDRSRQLAVERDQQAQLAAAAERTRIAREMHDVVSHSLTVVVSLADGVTATDDVDRSREASRAIASTARDALAQLRQMLGVLRTDPPTAADDSTLHTAEAPFEPLLHASVQDVVATAREAGFPVALTISGAPSGSAAERLAILRIVQEGLTNAMRYTHEPTRISVETVYGDGAVRVSVENDGVANDGVHGDGVQSDGVPARGSSSRGAGFGLQGLRERAAALGGTFEAGPIPPDSWRLVAELPVSADPVVEGADG